MYSQLQAFMKKNSMYEGTDYDVNEKIELHDVKNEAWGSVLQGAVVETCRERK